MFFLRKPNAAAIHRILEDPSLRPTYRPGEFTLHTDQNRALLGVNCFAAAKEEIRRWTMFDIGWVELWRRTPGAPLRQGETVAPLIRHLGFWSANPARVGPLIDEPRRFGFSYTTLTGHAECGEERFLVVWLESGEVWYSLRAASRPKHLLTWLGYPVTRALQKQFAQDSMRAMQRAVSKATS